MSIIYKSLHNVRIVRRLIKGVEAQIIHYFIRTLYFIGTKEIFGSMMQYIIQHALLSQRRRHPNVS